MQISDFFNSRQGTSRNAFASFGLRLPFPGTVAGEGTFQKARNAINNFFFNGISGTN